MSKGKCINLFCITLVAIASVFMATGAWAVCSTAELNAGTCGVIGSYEVRADVDSAGKFPIDCGSPYGKNCFSYTISPALNSASSTDKKYVDLLVSACTPSTVINVTAGSPGFNYSVPGGGSLYTKWLYGDYQERVVSFAAPTSAQTSKILIATDTAQTRITSMSIKDSPINQKYGSIIGPACSIVSGVSVQNSTEYKTVGDNNLRLERNASTGCISQMWIHDSTCTDGWCPITPDPLTVTGDTTVHTLQSCGSFDSNQKCQECTVVFHSPVYCSVISSGGVSYKVPRGCI